MWGRNAVVAGVLALAVAAVPANAMPKSSAQHLAWFQPNNIYHSGLRGTHTVALTFDDGPNHYTAAVLDALKALDVKATFFIVGRMAHAHPDILARIADEGHLLGNHSATHPLLDQTYVDNPDRLLDELRDVDDQIAPLMPADAKFYFRAPYGAWRPELADALNDDPVLRKYVGPIYWDEGGEVSFSDDGYILSAADWDCWRRGWDPATCAKGYIREIRRKDGGVVILHCIHAQSGALVAELVPPLIEEGYNFVRLDEVPGYQKYETTPQESEPSVASLDGPRPGAQIAQR
ncbi:MAG TPA: polysaccharide deacetylase family protein [Rhizomicrobium sp.]|jgi:peptidoglycan/xylan/chitin deacetylase (PgdA/CDA1 family)|nr:polysaccharide deacetylase family protein [Rhizomicrobium sp.]